MVSDLEGGTWSRTNFIAIIAFLALLGGTIWIAASIQEASALRDRSSEREVHTLKVLLTTQELRSALQDARAQASHDAARQRAMTKMGELRTLVSDNRNQDANIARLAQLSSALLRQPDRADFLSASATVVRAINSIEERLLVERRQTVRRAERQLWRYLAVAAIIGSILLATLAWAIARLARARHDRNEAQREALITQRLLQSRNLLQSVMDSSTDPIYVKDVDGRFVYVNQESVKLLGGTRVDNVIGKRDRDFLGVEIALALETLDQTIMASGEAVTAEEKVPRDGEDRVFLSAKVPWIQDGKIVGLIGISRDITDRVVAEQQLRKLNDELDARVAARTAELSDALASLETESREREQAEAQIRQMQKLESIGQLSGGIAHDFNNMLSIVMGSIEMGQRKLTGTEHPRVKLGMENAMEGAKRAATLTARLLAFARQQPLEPVALDANKLVGSTSELLQRTLGDDIQLETVLAGGLWTTFVDAPELENALVNLAVNARDAMPRGGHLTIETMNTHLDDSYAREHVGITAGQYVALCISDTGVGMSGEVIERVFEPFFTTKEIGKGTGLGLSQVFGFIRQSGGHVKVYSEVDQGTTVKIYLPRHQGKAAVVGPRPSSGGDAFGDPSEIILVVEDETRVREIASDALRELGYTVVEAENGRMALGILRDRDDITLLFTDIMMPDMNGRTLADAALAERKSLKVLYTTGYTRNAVVHNGMLDPGVSLLSKPYTLGDLGRKVRMVLDRE